ncbi:squalene synthase [Artemisia annua]|uniref:Squalene synthase n=1 Tax=Artemisia annua TaxID=35608 RepID=A0A2U1P763_ARTAN|nr:squalene synthase [Artemisia annua]
MSDGSKKARCKACNTYINSNGNSTLRKHTTKHCKATKGVPGSEQSVMGQDGSIFVYDEKALRQDLAHFVIQEGLPFNHFDNPRLTRLIQQRLQPRYNHVSRQTLKRDCIKSWVKVKKELILGFEALKTSVNLTTDVWSAGHGLPDVPTRWNSTYNMFVCGLRQKLTLQHFHDELCRKARHRDNLVPFSVENWGLIQKITDLLKVFKTATTMLSGVYYPTSHSVLNQIYVLCRKLGTYEYDGPLFTNMVVPMKEKLKKYFQEIPPVITCAAAINPCFNNSGVEYLIEKIAMDLDLDKEVFYIANAQESFKNNFKRLYDVYFQKYGAKHVGTSSVPNMWASSSNVDPVLDLFSSLRQESGKRARSENITSNEYGRYTGTDWLNTITPDEFKNFDVLNWWKQRESQFPVLAAMARDLLSSKFIKFIVWKTRTKKNPEKRASHAHCEEKHHRFLGTGPTGHWDRTGVGTDPEPGIPVPVFMPPDLKRTEPDWNRIRFSDFDHEPALIETIDDYEEYCHHCSGLAIMGLSRLFHALESEILFPDSLSNSVGLILHKTDIIIDYLEDINDIHKPRMFWPSEIWSKYVDNLETLSGRTRPDGPDNAPPSTLISRVYVYHVEAYAGILVWDRIARHTLHVRNSSLLVPRTVPNSNQDLKHEENAEKAVQCLNEMVTNALIHIDDCLKYTSQLRNPAIFKFFAIQQVIAIAHLALCYNNIEVFRCGVKVRRGLRAQVIYRTKTMADVYGAVYDFSSILKSKVDMNDPNAETTISRIDAVQKICRDSGSLDNWNSYVVESKPSYNRAFVTFLCLSLQVWFFTHIYPPLNW